MENNELERKREHEDVEVSPTQSGRALLCTFEEQKLLQNLLCIPRNANIESGTDNVDVSVRNFITLFYHPKSNC